jgi:hypothetical protein
MLIDPNYPIGTRNPAPVRPTGPDTSRNEKSLRSSDNVLAKFNRGTAAPPQRCGRASEQGTGSGQAH